MSKKVIITEDQLQHILERNDCSISRWLINEAIREEYSIRQDVLDASSDLSKKIQAEINNKENKRTEIEAGVIRIDFYLRNYNIFGKECGIQVFNYNFKDKKTYNRLCQKYWDEMRSGDSIYYPNNKRWMCTIRTCSISGTLIKQISNDVIQYEVEHLYQQANADTELPKDKNYSIAYSILRTGKPTYDDLAIQTALVLYYSYSFEQDEFVNGLYQYLINGRGLYGWEEIGNTDAVQVLNNMRNGIRYIKQQPQKKVEHILNKWFKLSYHTFVNLTDKAEKRFIKKIGRVLYKHREDMIQKGARLNENLNNRLYMFF